jgi:hypothetical protein
MSDDRIPVQDVRNQLVDHVRFMKRYRDPGWRMADEIVAHRRQCLANFLAAEEPHWLERVKVLDQIADAEGVPLVDEQSVRDVMSVVVDRERKRREEIRERRIP